MAVIPEPNEAAPIGEFVRAHLPQIFEYCERNPAELTRLQDKQYCRDTFHQSYLVLRVGREAKPPKYWAKVHSVLGQDVRVTSEWVSKLHSAHFIAYLVRLDIRPIGISPEFIEWALETVDKFGTTSAAPGGARYRSAAIGIAQNALVRHLLGNIPQESFTKADWEAVKEEFDGCCAYCGRAAVLHMDHAVPINMTSVGEHRLGNLVPACAPCNGKKGQSDHRRFLQAKYADEPEAGHHRLRVIEEHMRRHGYEPITEVDGVRELLVKARAELAAVATTYLDQINKRISGR